MHYYCTTTELALTTLVFALSMILIVRYASSSEVEVEEYLVASRMLGWKRAALSIAVSWVWAPAIFIASLQSYTKGIAGAFWFIAPNIICFFVFAPIAVKIRKSIPDGYSFPDYISSKYKENKWVHLSFLLIFLAYQLGSIIINSVAGGLLLNQLSGVSITLATLVMPVIALVYSLRTGMRASVRTDVFQMLFLLIVAGFIVPWLIINSGGIANLMQGLGGKTGEFSNLLHPGIAYAFGIPMTIGLVTGPLADQMFFQRAFSVKEKDIMKTFVVGGLLFGLVPILLCIPGFVAVANPNIVILNPEMVAPAVIAFYLPHWALILFTGMAICGLCSTLDSSFCALSSLGAIDIYKRYVEQRTSKKDLLEVSRNFMLGFSVVGISIALLQPKLLWLSLIYGILAGAGFFPLIFSVFSKSIRASYLSFAVIFSLLVSLPLSIYANVHEETNLIVLSSIISVGLGLGVCLVGVWSGRGETRLVS